MSSILKIRPAGMSYGRALEIAMAVGHTRPPGEARPSARKMEAIREGRQIAKLNAEGLTDSEVAEALGFDADRVRSRRRRMNLPSNTEGSTDDLSPEQVDALIIELNSHGWADIAIGRHLFRDGAWVRRQRERLDLHPTHERGKKAPMLPTKQRGMSS